MARPRAATSKPRHPHAHVLTRSPSHPPATRGRPSEHVGITPARRTLVAALSSTHRPPSRVELTNACRDTAVALRSSRPGRSSRQPPCHGGGAWIRRAHTRL